MALIFVLGMEYFHRRTANGGDLWLTKFGAPLWEHVSPESWYASDWFETRRISLGGTSAIYRVPSRPVRNVSMDLVVRFSRVGEEIPLDTGARCEYWHAEFNSPFEEFSLVTYIRTARPELRRRRILTKRPLAIFSPPQRLELWQTGRRKCVFAQKQSLHPDVTMDIRRQYVLIYGWIKGMNAVQAAETIGLTGSERESFLTQVTLEASCDLSQRGTRMLDIKPQHIIVRVRPDGSLLRTRYGRIVYGLVDYELLERFGSLDTCERKELT
jgi:hypothetical protein